MVNPRERKTQGSRKFRECYFLFVNIGQSSFIELYEIISLIIFFIINYNLIFFVLYKYIDLIHFVFDGYILNLFVCVEIWLYSCTLISWNCIFDLELILMEER